MNPSVLKEEIKEAEIVDKTVAETPSNGIKTAKKIFSSLNVMSYVDKEMLLKFMPYAFFLMLLALLYIGNSYRTDKTIREIDKVSKEIKELRSEYISGKSELELKSQQSAVAKQVAGLGLSESRNPPKKIVVK